MKKLLALLLFTYSFSFADDVQSFSNANIDSYLDSHGRTITDNSNIITPPHVIATQNANTRNISTNTTPTTVIINNNIPTNNSNNQQTQQVVYSYPVYPNSYNYNDMNNQQTYNRLQNYKNEYNTIKNNNQPHKDFNQNGNMRTLQ